ncbi:MAG TPA: GIY-YIG nuclease family protein [Longimicrobium sp.]|nr:GIY-YIG nuclease family protein [Longimicrobium sp.]
MLNLDSHFSWSEWSKLEDCVTGGPIPPQPGLYRIRRVGRAELDYIGQSGQGGMHLRKRLAMLKGVYGLEMPYRDPHTAGPGLWALLREGARFEVSFACVEGSTSWRKGMEALAIALYRQDHRQSPSLNFGRMPGGYAISSQRNAKLRGGPTVDELDCHHPSIPPAGPLTGTPDAPDWSGHRWSAWEALPTAIWRTDAAVTGLYRIRAKDDPSLLYVGQGVISARLRQHLRKATASDDAQGRIFRAADSLEVSWVANRDWRQNQRLELENDLIAAHVLVREAPPPAQFIGRSL